MMFLLTTPVTFISLGVSITLSSVPVIFLLPGAATELDSPVPPVPPVFDGGLFTVKDLIELFPVLITVSVQFMFQLYVFGVNDFVNIKLDVVFTSVPLLVNSKEPSIIREQLTKLSSVTLYVKSISCRLDV